MIGVGLILMQIVFTILWFADAIDWSLWLVWTPGILWVLLVVFYVIVELADE